MTEEVERKKPRKRRKRRKKNKTTENNTNSSISVDLEESTVESATEEESVEEGFVFHQEPDSDSEKRFPWPEFFLGLVLGVIILVIFSLFYIRFAMNAERRIAELEYQVGKMQAERGWEDIQNFVAEMKRKNAVRNQDLHWQIGEKSFDSKGLQSEEIFFEVDFEHSPVVFLAIKPDNKDVHYKISKVTKKSFLLSISLEKNNPGSYFASWIAVSRND